MAVEIGTGMPGGSGGHQFTGAASAASAKVSRRGVVVAQISAAARAAIMTIDAMAVGAAVDIGVTPGASLLLLEVKMGEVGSD